MIQDGTDELCCVLGLLLTVPVNVKLHLCNVKDVYFRDSRVPSPSGQDEHWVRLLFRHNGVHAVAKHLFNVGVVPQESGKNALWVGSDH